MKSLIVEDKKKIKFDGSGFVFFMFFYYFVEREVPDIQNKN